MKKQLQSGTEVPELSRNFRQLPVLDCRPLGQLLDVPEGQGPPGMEGVADPRPDSKAAEGIPPLADFLSPPFPFDRSE